MIEVRNISKTFGEIQALKGISLTVESGQIVGFLGANGAGKTTTMDIICGCIGADEGDVSIAGSDITSEPLDAKAKLGYLPDIPPLHLDMIVKDAIEYSAKLNKVPNKKIEERVQFTIEKMDLKSVENRLVGNLSKGFRQRVAFAQALVHDPKVLVLDEPTEGLDPNQIAHMRDLIKDLKGDHTIILSSHILSEVQSICDRIIIIHNGQIAREGTYDELVGSLEKEHCYVLKTKKSSQQLKENLGTLEGVLSVAMEDERSNELRLKVDLSKDSIVDDIAKVVLDGGFGLQEIISKTKSLEDVFFQVTH